MTTHETGLLALGIALAVLALTLMVLAVRWVGRDARARGFSRVWLLQVLTVLEFPWAFLMYFVVSRNLDARAGRARHAVSSSG